MVKNIFYICVSFVIFFLSLNLALATVSQSENNVSIESNYYYSYYDLTNDNFTVRLATDLISANNGNKSYFVNPNNWLDDTKCIVGIDSNIISTNFQTGLRINSNLELFFLDNYYNLASIINTTILEKNYYMKTNVIKEFIDPQENIVATIQPLNVDGLDYQYGDGVPYSTYILAKPTSVQIQFNSTQMDLIKASAQANCDLYGGSYCGTYTWKTTAIPIDGKCDFNNNNNLNDFEILENSEVIPIEISTTTYPDFDSDDDGILDINDNCPLIPGKFWFKGCNYKYTEISKYDDVIFDEANQKIICTGDFDGDAQIRFNGGNYLSGISTNLYDYDHGSGIYTCYDNDYLAWFDRTLGTIELQNNLNSNYIELNGEIYFINKEKGTFSIDKNTNEIKFGTVVISPTQSSIGNIKTYYNDKLILDENIDYQKIALATSVIKRQKNENEAESSLFETIDLMNKFQIEKHIDTTSNPGFSRIKIELNNTQDSDLNNLTIYQIISKDDLNNYADINIISNNGQFITLDKDPVIGWYFNESTGNEVIEYEIPGESEGGIIIITQEPILFNEGELIINYRENNCAAGEAHLFDLSDLEDSLVLSPNSGVYKVCVAHITEDLYANSDNQNLHIFNTSSSKVYIENKSQTGTSIDISTTNTSIYWNMVISKENPDSNFSCLGSVNSLNDGLFGDCGYNENNRIWLHLGKDITPPKTTITIPYLSHTTKIILTVDDGFGSGVKNASYRIDGGNWISYTDSVEFTLTCPNDWSCIKLIEYQSFDNAENHEEIKTYNLNIIDKASACESSCLAKPSPDRYLKECRNLNGCFYYPFNNLGINDDGIYVAEQCNFQTKDAVVEFNTTHDITCPNGPLVKTRTTKESFYPLESYCENIKTTSYPVIFKGEQILMNIITCIGKYK